MMTEHPKVSIIVPVYEVEEYVGQCAASLFSQTWDNCEFIFVDDGTPDRSVSVIEKVLDQDFPHLRPCVKIIHEPNSGVNRARMTGLAAATGDFIIQVDSDDWAEPDYIDHLVRKVMEEDADVVYCDFYKEYKKRHKLYVEGDFSPSTGPVAAKSMHNSIIRAYMWNKLVRSSLYDLPNMVVPKWGYHEDIVLQTQILYGARKVYHLREALYHYRRHRRGALTSGSIARTHTQSAENMFLLYDALPKDKGPLTACGEDILLRGGWYSACLLNFKLLRAHPEAVKALLDMDYVHGCRVPVCKQRYTKFICRILRLTDPKDFR